MSISVDLVRLASLQRMTPRDVRDDPPLLPDCVRVIAMREDRTVLPWMWADSVPWWSVIAWRTQDDGTNFLRCDLCGEMAATTENGTCDACWEHGDFELDGEPDEA